MASLGGKPTSEGVTRSRSFVVARPDAEHALQRTPAREAARREEHFRAGHTGERAVPCCWGARRPGGAVMPEDRDFKRLVRARMQNTGERYTQARAALVAQREAGDPLVSDRTRSLLGQLADVGLAAASRDHLERLREPERRAAAIEGLQHGNWRGRPSRAPPPGRGRLPPRGGGGPAPAPPRQAPPGPPT